MEPITLQLGDQTFTLALNFNTTIALLSYQEALVARGQRGLDETDVRGLLARIALPGTPLSEKLTLVRTMLWALIASDDHPEWIEQPMVTAWNLGRLISPDRIDEVTKAIEAIGKTIAREIQAESKSAAAAEG